MLTFIVHCYFLLSPGISFIYVLARVCPISRYPSRHILFFLHFVAFQIFLPRGLNVRFIFLLFFHVRPLHASHFSTFSYSFAHFNFQHATLYFYIFC
jgi:hypothetical protein